MRQLHNLMLLRGRASLGKERRGEEDKREEKEREREMMRSGNKRGRGGEERVRREKR